MTSSLAMKLECFATLSGADHLALARFEGEVHELRARTDLIRQGDRTADVHLLLEGWACRYKLLPDGGRQIVAYLVPGDLTALYGFGLRRMDHSIGALGPAKIASFPEERVADMMAHHPNIARALRWATLVDAATAREWIVNIGRREPDERIAHLLCEMLFRMDQVHLVTAGRFSLPLTQTQMGDTVALTPVTVNRVLQRLRRAELITLRGGDLCILNAAELIALSGFDPTYLLGHDEAGLTRSQAGH